MIKVGLMGASGYAGADLLRLLLQRDDVDLVFAGSNSTKGLLVSDLYPNLARLTDLRFTSIDFENTDMFDKIDLLFLALPHKVSQEVVKVAFKKDIKIIDLSADFRLDDKDVYEDWYQVDHTSPEELEAAIYGLTEVNREEIKNARLIANPGCYPTSVILGLYPLLKEHPEINFAIADSKSGVSGAGRGLKDPNLYCQANESMKAYALSGHRHQPEIEQELRKISKKNFDLVFTPHLVPMDRGMLSTIYIKNDANLKQKDIDNIYNNYYQGERFIRYLGTKPGETKAVTGSNYCDISAVANERSGYIVITSVIDNLLKGASGQAMQNMNLMFGLEEDTGLKQVPLWP